MPRKSPVLPIADVDPSRPIEDQLDDLEPMADAEFRGSEPKKRGRKPKEEPVARTFSVAGPAETLANLLITDHYPELKHQPIRYVFTSHASEIDGEPVICKPGKISGLNAWLASGQEDGEACPFFCVVISQTHWDSMPMKGREAFLDGALAQFTVSKTGALKMRRPDIRETSHVLARHGMYSAALKKQASLIQKALEQPALELAS